MTIRFDGRVAIVTGAGGGLGRCHALGLAARGAKVVVNDLGRDGEPSEASTRVVREIEAAGGLAMANGADVANSAQVAAMVEAAHTKWGSVDILVNNAGILRDKTFAKMELADFELVLKVHLLGSAICTKAVWAGMRERNYGRVMFTASASGVVNNRGSARLSVAVADWGVLPPPATLIIRAVALPLFAVVLDEVPGAPTIAPFTSSISFCRRKSCAEGVTTHRCATRTCVAPAVAALCASRIVNTF